MGHNVFVSYKYHDTDVKDLPNRKNPYTSTRVRDYVDIIEKKITDESGSYYYGEHDGENLTGQSDDYIWDKLKDKMFKTTVTIVLISPNMKEEHRYDTSQWIPWEIYYSLHKEKRGIQTSQRNGVLAVALPDRYGSYDYAIENKHCYGCNSGCRFWHTDKFFTIIAKNMFNQDDKTKKDCEAGGDVYTGFCSYIHLITWEQFVENMDSWINIASFIKENVDDYTLWLDVNKS